MKLAVAVTTVILAAAFAAPPGLPPVGPLSPREELATFRVPKGFKVELVACEPDVVDPVAMAFDERGRLFVAEMRGYPNGGVGTGQHTGGRVRCLEDRDGDGYFETATTFVDGLRFPTAVMPITLKKQKCQIPVMTCPNTSRTVRSRWKLWVIPTIRQWN